MAATATPYRSQNWALTKPAARGRHGIVVSQSREAAEAGTEILEQGGNAADAAVAACFALAAVEPWNSGLGGIGFAVVLEAGESRAHGYQRTGLLAIGGFANLGFAKNFDLAHLPRS